jgi:hypothetical protein
MASVSALPRSLRSRGSVKDVPEQSGKDVMKLNTIFGGWAEITACANVRILIE